MRIWSAVRVSPIMGRSVLCILSGALVLATSTRLTAQENPLAPASPPPQPKQPQPAAPPPPAPPREKPPAKTGVVYSISSFEFVYDKPVTGAPTEEDIQKKVKLLVSLDGDTFIAGREGSQQIEVAIEDLSLPSRARRNFDKSAIQAICGAIVTYMNKTAGIVGIRVLPDPKQIDQVTGKNLRPPNQSTLRIVIYAPTVEQVRTLATGQRWAGEAKNDRDPSMDTRIDNKRHARIRENSPLQPGVNGAPGDLVRKDLLDDYLYRLNRQPGRRVDAAIGSLGTPGGVSLDYLVSENRPWVAYFQLSNTGTKETDEWRERFGFAHHQITNHDDTLAIDFITAGFDASNAVVASYDRPLNRSETLRGKIYGSYSEFKASDVGFASQAFKGESWSVGGELTYNLFQRHQVFVDAFGGARFERHHVTNNSSGIQTIEGHDTFFIPYAGVRLERVSQLAASELEARLEGSVSGITESDIDAAQRLGRLNVDDTWTAFKLQASQSFFIEPFLYARNWEDATGPVAKTTLAHEGYVSARAQYAFERRIIPQDEITVGGLYTVRGYPESLTAGDNAVIGTVEYRFHLPRVLGTAEPGTLFNRPFRYRPEQEYGRPDWDLIFRGFVDAGYVTNSHRQSFERDETLVGAGVGVELDVKQNLSVRMDWAIALRDAGSTSSGATRVHFVLTLLY